ncbi:hypothetical protein Asi02nite_67630 [Asanoa siamensis]|uniref:YncI copper-binding domain-containing protein n=2 Tax=Asanoa siamensis TaxID=926357 RepID=A0ABQ4D149_9ACTN|nr:hypothetical protein Asi02nite_67630 [Asanoa siamensis]
MAAGLGVAALVGLAGAVGFGIGPASAHVTVNATGATQGGYAKLAFRVPNERDNASTVKVEVNIPAETAVASVSVRPTPGWTATTEKSKLATPLKAHGEDITEAVTKITWTAAAGSEVKPGEFQEFEVSAGPLPEVDQMVFKALQTYSNNEVVRWIDEPAAGAEAEHPAPVLKLAKAGATGGAAASPAANANVNLAASADDSGDSSTGTVTGVAGLVLALAALIFAVLAWRRSSTAKG